ncbi:MAG TPA: hypothetical protein VJT31_21210 [Rugosimonospora sp.]|nr:hypothetical protein [Rugosimonospora sp.]
MVAVQEAAAAVRAGGGDTVGRLFDALLDVDETGNADLAGEALRVLQEMPRVVARLDEWGRRIVWQATTSSQRVDQVAQRLAAGAAGPVAVALASTHRDGHVRERAVERILAAPLPEWMPFVVLRTADWVRPVRDRARVGLALLLADAPATYLAAVLGVTLLGRGRQRGGFAYTQALAALLAASPAVRDGLLTAGRAQRRFVYEVGMAQGWWSADVLFSLAVAEHDPGTRVRATEVVCRRAVWSNQVDTLLRLSRHPHPQVRALALTGLLRLGCDADVAGRLDDPAPLVRAIARAAARRGGANAVEHYRAAVAAGDPPPGAIAGLAETGSQSDASLLEQLLASSTTQVRVQAVRASRQLDAVPIERTIRLLRDPSPAVVREATAALRPFTRAVPAELAWDLLAEAHRVDLRRAGYRLLRVRTVVEQLKAALLLAGDPNPRLARRAVADATRLARDAATPAWRRLRLPALDLTPAQIADLAGLVERAAAALGPDTAGLLRAWLAKTTPS